MCEAAVWPPRCATMPLPPTNGTWTSRVRTAGSNLPRHSPHSPPPNTSLAPLASLSAFRSSPASLRPSLSSLLALLLAPPTHCGQRPRVTLRCRHNGQRGGGRRHAPRRSPPTARRRRAAPRGAAPCGGRPRNTGMGVKNHLTAALTLSATICFFFVGGAPASRRLPLALTSHRWQ